MVWRISVRHRAVQAKPMTFNADPFSSVGAYPRELYRELLKAIRAIGQFREDFKKTSVHLVRSSAFIGVHPRKDYLVLTIKAAARIKSPRVFKAEQVSKNRWHLDLKLSRAEEIDAELLGWVGEAYELCA
ncbi:MAG: DUF5655 domain-containing protein [Terriglobales bacterium]